MQCCLKSIKPCDFRNFSNDIIVEEDIFNSLAREYDVCRILTNSSSNRVSRILRTDSNRGIEYCMVTAIYKCCAYLYCIVQ